MTLNSLADFVQIHDTVEVPQAGAPITLRLYGLGADAIAFLARNHGEVLGAVYTAAISGQIDETNVGDAISAVMDEGPILAATIIAFGCQAPDQIEAAARLPLAVQVEAIEKIVRLTFSGDVSGKKLAEIVNKVVGVTSGLTPQRTSTSGSTESADS